MDIKYLVERSHKTAVEHGFWEKSQNKAEKLMLIVTEVSEACEADRKGDDAGFKMEIADVFIRLGDLCGMYNIDIEKEIERKMEINDRRPYLHGKNY